MRDAMHYIARTTRVAVCYRAIFSIFGCLMLMLPLIRRSRQAPKLWVRVQDETSYKLKRARDYLARGIRTGVSLPLDVISLLLSSLAEFILLPFLCIISTDERRFPPCEIPITA